jgi:Fe-S-cluster-containing hydrogenase component 2
MLTWLTNRWRNKKHAELLSQAIAQLEENRETNKRAVALCENCVQVCDSQARQLVEARAENLRLWTALSAPKELQPYIVAGCSQPEAEKLAKEAPRGA